jgi:hypothetical protein
VLEPFEGVLEAFDGVLEAFDGELGVVVLDVCPEWPPVIVSPPPVWLPPPSEWDRVVPVIASMPVTSPIANANTATTPTATCQRKIRRHPAAPRCAAVSRA